MILLAFFMHAMLAVIFPLGRAALSICDPAFFTASRMILGGIFFLVLNYVRTGKFVEKHGLFTKDTWWILFIVSVFNIYLTNVPEMWALQFIPSAKASFIYTLCPFLAAILAFFLFNERLTHKKIIGMSIGFIGFAMMIIVHAPQEIDYGGVGYLSLGELAVILAAFATVYGWANMRKLVRSGLISSIEANGISMVWGGVISMLHSFLTESWHPVPVSDWSLFGVYLAIAVIAVNVLGFGLYGHLLKQYTTTILSFIGFSEPFVAAIFGWFFLSEYVTWHFYAAAVFVFTGLYIFYVEELAQGYIVKKN